MSPLPDNLVQRDAPYQWQDLELSEKVENSELNHLRGRLDPTGVLRLKGALIVKFGQTVKNGQTFAVLPAALRPSTRVVAVPIVTSKAPGPVVACVPMEAVLESGALILVNPGTELAVGDEIHVECAFDVNPE